jgi:hypothetical protein
MWLRHFMTDNLAPIDVNPVANGNCTVDLEKGTYEVLGPRRLKQVQSRPLGVALHTSHFASCGQASAWRHQGAERG